MEVIIRHATPADAAAMVAYGTQLSHEPDSNVEMSPGEFTHSIDSEKVILEQFLDSKNSIFLVVEYQDEIIGMLSCQGGKRKVRQHVAHLSMSVREDFRGKGIGTKLMDALLDWAKNNAMLSRLELIVFARNVQAIHLYQKFGFITEGCFHRAVHRNGEYLDTIPMALVWEAGK
ncbi:MAG: GNAT family N-acetyltransferase [Anaerolineaceae bacterium]|nr:GNAT family N-acetyltransferase [Anaerolineaceae bacterium]